MGIRLLLAVSVLCALTVPAYAQTGTVSGTVVDESGGVVPGATVTLTGPGSRATMITGSSGEYRFANVAAGT